MSRDEIYGNISQVREAQDERWKETKIDPSDTDQICELIEESIDTAYSKTDNELLRNRFTSMAALAVAALEQL